MIKNNSMYLFNWREIPGNDSIRLIEYLIQNFGYFMNNSVYFFNFNEIKTENQRKKRKISEFQKISMDVSQYLTLNNDKKIATLKINALSTEISIEKTNEDNAINISTGKSSVLLKLSNDKTRAILRINKMSTDVFIVKSDTKEVHNLTLDVEQKNLLKWAFYPDMTILKKVFKERKIAGIENVIDGMVNTYLQLLKNDMGIAQKDIADQIGVSATAVSENVQLLLDHGYLLRHSEQEYFPINPSVLYYMSYIYNKKNYLTERDPFFEKTKMIRQNLQNSWNENFLKKPLVFELLIDSQAAELVAWLNFCGWIDNFKDKQPICIDIRFFTPVLELATEVNRMEILDYTLQGFKGSFHVYTTEEKKKELIRIKDYFQKFNDVTFIGRYIVSENCYCYFNKCLRAAMIGNILATITLKRGSNYAGPLFYNQTSNITYINKCFEYIEKNSEKI